ncbi:MAG: HPr family phosphocarrier protein [Planctomycetes bacterium]|nr:HPr family phosphocarrier protein [Planctomycetota bacterium]
MQSARADKFEHAFCCPLPNGLHARPASQLANLATRYASEFRLTNERTATVANAKSVLDVVAMDVRCGDGCRMEIFGEDAEPAHAALCEFVTNVLPTCDEPIDIATVERQRVLPPSLRRIIGMYFEGRAICSGIGQGSVIIARSLSLPTELGEESPESMDEARRKVRVAITALRSTLEAQLSAKPVSGEAAILRAHLAIAGDVGLAEFIEARILKNRSAAQAVLEAGRAFAAKLNAAQSGYIRERAVDVEDICLQLLEIIRGESFSAADIHLEGPSVVVADTLTPRQILSLDKRHVSALVLAHGGTTSHAVILARSFSIPTLVGVADARAKLARADEAIVDAQLGLVIPSITPNIKRYYEREQRKLQARSKRLRRFLFKPPTTTDGATIDVAANVSTAEELAQAFLAGADGIGLFRTEMLFMDREAPPTEEEQYSVYLQAARAAGDKPVIIRTFDVGGDKPVPYLDLPQSTSAFTGYRGVRVYPQYRELFRSQLRAVIRATAFGNIQVMAQWSARWTKSGGCGPRSRKFRMSCRSKVSSSIRP